MSENPIAYEPPKKCDVHVTFYKQEHYAEMFCWGLRQNADAINRIFVVNDDLWSGPQITAVVTAYGGTVYILRHESEVEELIQTGDPNLPNMLLMEHPHVGFGPAICANQSMRYSQSEYLFTTGSDQILPPDTLSTILLYGAPRRVIIGAVHHLIPEDFRMEHLPDKVQIAVPDWRIALHTQFFKLNRQWMVCHNGHNLWHRESLLALGGFNEDYCKYGVTMEDMELGARWMMAYGANSLYFGPTFSWHFGDRHNPKKREERGLPSSEFRAEMARTLGKLYDHRWYFFPDRKQLIYSHAMMIPGNPTFPPYEHDARPDCYDLSWMEPDSAREIIYIAGHEWCSKEQFATVAATVTSRLRPWGTIKVFLAEDSDYNASYVKQQLEAAGLIIEEFNARVIIATREEDDE